MAVGVLLLSLPALAQDVKLITSKAEIDRILNSIPSNDRSMPYKTLAERLPNLGLVVNDISFGKLQADEIRISQGLYWPGDVLYQFSTNEPNDAVKRICPIWRSFSLLRRGNRWLPQDRTSNFLLNGYACNAP